MQTGKRWRRPLSGAIKLYSCLSSQAETVDNRVLIELEKFYQTSSLLMGLSALNPDAPTRAAWRAYDRFHFDQVKTKLSLYGPTIIL